MIRYLIIMVALLALIAGNSCQAAAPPPWFSDNFDSYSPGDLNGQGPWRGSEKSFQAQNTLAKSGNGMLCDYRTNGPGQISAEVKSTGGLNLIEMDVYMDASRSIDGGQGKAIVDVDISGPSGGPVTRLSLAYGQLKLALANREETVLCAFPNGKWMHVAMLVNLTANTVDVFVDGDLKLRGGFLMSVGTSIGKITISDWMYGYAFDKSSVCIDNLTCRSIETTAAWALGRNTAWERSMVSSPFVMYDAGAKEYKMYYTGTAGGNNGESTWSIWHIGLATSKEGVGFGRVNKRSDPVLWSTKFLEGDILNPADVAKRFDSVWAIGACVIKDGRQYKMWYTGWSGEVEHIAGGVDNKINYRIGYATSPDGIAWTRHKGAAGAGSTLGLGVVGSLDDKAVGQPWVLKEKNLYRMWYEGFDGKLWRIFYATSSDGMKWTRRGVVLKTGGYGSLDALGARYPVVVKRKGQYELWYQSRGASQPSFHILRAVSPDGVKWKKAPGEVVFGPPNPLDTDEQIYVDSVIVQPDGACRAYFAKEDISATVTPIGSVDDRRFSNYTEVVNP